jgi:hypothetical protein
MVALDGVHADAVAEKRPSGAAPGGVDQQQSDPLLRKLESEAAHQFIDHAALARTARAGEADHRRRRSATRTRQTPQQGVGLAAALLALGFEPADAARDGRGVPRPDSLSRVAELRSRLSRAFVDDALDHALEPQSAAVLGAEDPGHAVRFELAGLLAGDGAAAAAIHTHVGYAELGQALDQVAEELHVPALVGRDGHGVRIFVQAGPGDLLDRAVVAQVHHLRAEALEDPAHDVDGGVVTVEERGRGDDANAARRLSGAARGRRGAHADSRLAGSGSGPMRWRTWSR